MRENQEGPALNWMADGRLRMDVCSSLLVFLLGLLERLNNEIPIFDPQSVTFPLSFMLEFFKSKNWIFNFIRFVYTQFSKGT